MKHLSLNLTSGLAASLLAFSLLGCSAGDGSSDSCEPTDTECIRALCTDDAGVLDSTCVTGQCAGDVSCQNALVPGGTGNALGSTGATLELEDARATCATSNVGPRLLRRLSRHEVEATLIDLFPEVLGTWSGVKLSPDPASALGFTTDASVLVVGGPTAKDMLKTAENVAEIVTSAEVLPSVLSCAGDANAACAGTFIDNYGFKLFRRPLTEDDKARYVALYDSVSGRSDFRTGLKWTLAAMIQSPHTFYRREIGTSQGGTFKLSPYELATNLSYTYTGSVPDADLLAKAADGSISSPEVLRSEAERLMTTGAMEGGRGWNTMRAFFLEWLEYGKVLGQSREANPDFADKLSPQLVDETRIFIDTLILGDRGDIRDLMLADFTALNAELSAFYGFGAATGWEKVKREPGQGLGILAQGSLLAATSHQEATSPTLRGLLFSKRFLCMTKPKPPDIVPPIEETAPTEGLTTRQKYEDHHAQGVCGACHQAFEPFGYNLESFDEMGRYRTMDAGMPVDTTSSVSLPDGSTKELATLEELAGLVDVTPDVENCISGLLTAYMLSGGGGTTCLAEEQRTALRDGNMSLYDFLLNLTQTAHFSSRR